jgi:hypothetical protein
MSSGSFAVTAAAMGAPGNGEHDDTSKDQQPASHVRSLSGDGTEVFAAHHRERRTPVRQH